MTTVGILYFGAREVIDSSLTVGQLVAFNMLAQRVSNPVLRIAQIWQDFQQAKLSVDRLGDILNTPTERILSSVHLAPESLHGEIIFHNVDFRYNVDGPIVLSGFSVRINRGETVGVVGVSGSGKSTLAKLIQGLFVPTNGRVQIDGHDVALLDQSWLRRHVGVVLQESFLFSGSIMDNIRVSCPTASLEEVIEAATLAGAHEFITAKPFGYSTEIGERGATLSGGQRQRIAIARTLLGSPSILIFDEATSALDYESESAIQANMREITRNRTTLIIAHRLSTVKSCTRILTLENGCLVEDGSHEQLVRAGGRYSRLCALQSNSPVEALQ